MNSDLSRGSYDRTHSNSSDSVHSVIGVFTLALGLGTRIATCVGRALPTSVGILASGCIQLLSDSIELARRPILAHLQRTVELQLTVPQYIQDMGLRGHTYRPVFLAPPSSKSDRLDKTLDGHIQRQIPHLRAFLRSVFQFLT